MEFKQDLYIICEIDESQTKKIADLIKINFKQTNIVIKKDLAGFDRMVIIKVL